MILHWRKQCAFGVSLVVMALVAGCAFDVSHVRQQPAQFTAAAPPAREFVLTKLVKAKLGTGFPTVLNAGTRWRQVGSVQQGDVFATRDQVVMVEASNNYEAYLVVAAGSVRGFYLPVERTFVAVARPIPLETANLETP